jgi:myo-inositol 2-dehydrogenase/D-chiro-inositol 1-dehydrogenase
VDAVLLEKSLALNVPDCERVLAASEKHRPFLVRSQTCDQNDPEGFLMKFAPTSGGTMALHPGLQACGDADNGIPL